MQSKYKFLPLVVIISLIFGASVAVQAIGNSYIKGTVTQAGRPLRSAWVILSQDQSEKGRSLTGDDGKYYIGDLEGGNYDLLIERGSKELCRRRVSLPQDSKYDVTLPCR